MTANLLSLPLPVIIFTWGTLKFPHPSKTFWVVMIAYIQVIILIKCASQFDFFWWNDSNQYIKLLGNKRQKSSVLFELSLLMVICLHRAVLKGFGIWNFNEEFELREGLFWLEECDPGSSKLILHTLKSEEGMNSVKSEMVILSDSNEKLVPDENHLMSPILYKHEVKKDFEDNQMKVKEIKFDREKILKAKEEIEEDDKGDIWVYLLQDDINLKLRLLDNRIYPAVRLVTVESNVEEPLDFFPATTMMSIKRHSCLFSSFLNLINIEQTVTRKHVDVYTFMFFCDLLCFFVLFFGFAEFAVRQSLSMKLFIIVQLSYSSFDRHLTTAAYGTTSEITKFRPGFFCC